MKERTGAGKDTEKQRRKSIKKWRRKAVQEKEEYGEAERKQDKKKRRRRKRKGNGEMGKLSANVFREQGASVTVTVSR